MASGTFSKTFAKYWTLRVDWTSVANTQSNNSSVSITAYLVTPKLSIGSRTCTVTIGGVSQTFTAPAIKTEGNATVTLGSAHQIVSHDADGTKTIEISLVYPIQATLNGVYYSSVTASDSNCVLDDIPRYATVTQALSYKDETRIFTTWTSSAPVDYVWESSDNGVTWTGSVYHGETSGSANFYNLTPGTNYNLKIKVRRQDNQLVTESTALTVSTYYWPYCTAVGNFTVGGTATLTIYNPMNRSYSVSIKAESAAFYDFTGTYNGGTANIDTSVAAVKQYFYEAITGSSSGTYTVKITPATIGSTPTTSGSGTFTANPADCAPTIGALAYRDTNATTVAITGDDQDIVQNKSTVQYTATGLTAAYGATVSTASLEVNGQTYPLTISSGTATGGNAVINSASSVYATLTVTDSRGITSTAQVYVNILAWSVPSAIITCERQDNFYTATDLTVDADYASLNGGNSITITYAATKEGDLSPSVTGSLSDNVTSTANLDNSYAWDIVFTVSDLLGTATFSSHISRGMPIIYFDRLRSSVGVNCFPKTDKSLEVDGQRLNNIKMYRNAVGTPAVTTSPRSSAKWDVTDNTVTQYWDGMIVSIKVPVAGNSSYGTVFQINSLGYKPVVYNVNSGISTRYSVDSNVICVYNATQTASAYLSGSVTITGCWQVMDYNADTTNARGFLDYYFRPQAGSNVYRYKLCMQGANGRVYPIVTTDQEDATQVVKSVQTAGLKPYNIWYYTGTATISAGSAFGAQSLNDAYYFTTCTYNFNADIATYRMVYLCGSYDKTTDLFTLDNSTNNSYYTQVPTNAASINLTDYFTAGKYYLLVGGSYSTKNYLSLFAYNPFYYFDGTNLIPATSKVAADSATYTFTATEGAGTVTLGDSKTLADVYDAWSTGKPTYISTSNCRYFVSSMTLVSGTYYMSALGTGYLTSSAILLKQLSCMAAGTATNLTATSKTLT